MASTYPTPSPRLLRESRRAYVLTGPWTVAVRLACGVWRTRHVADGYEAIEVFDAAIADLYETGHAGRVYVQDASDDVVAVVEVRS